MTIISEFFQKMNNYFGLIGYKAAIFIVNLLILGAGIILDNLPSYDDVIKNRKHMPCLETVV